MIIEIAKKIAEAGGRLYLVGGATRDILMGCTPKDRDYAVTGVSKNEFLDLFPSAKLIGNDFPVFLLEQAEFALARTERKVESGYKGFCIYTDKNITIEEDLKRRDITINAIAQDVLTGEWVDPFNGRRDIKEKRIRKVSQAFAEDPLRVYRVARFACRYEFNVDDETLKYMNHLKQELTTISKERVYQELKNALTEKKPSLFFKVLKSADVLEIHFKELANLVGVEQPALYHPEGDAFSHSMIVLDKCADKTEDVFVRFAALVHDLGKGNTPKEEWPHHILHEARGILLVETLCQRLGLPNKWEKAGKEACKYHMKLSQYQKMRPYRLAKLFNELKNSAIGIQNLEYIVNCDSMIKEKEEAKFAELAEEMFKVMNGKVLEEQDIKKEEIGVDNFLHILYTKQAEFILKNR